MDSHLNPATNPTTTPNITTNSCRRKGSGNTRIQMRLTNSRAVCMVFSAAVIFMILSFLLPLALANSGDQQTVNPILVKTDENEEPIIGMPAPEHWPQWMKDGVSPPPGYTPIWPDQEGNYLVPRRRERTSRRVIVFPDGGEGGEGDGGGGSRNIIVWPRGGGGIVSGGSRRIIVLPPMWSSGGGGQGGHGGGRGGGDTGQVGTAAP